ncbi:EthD domain-containing protein [Nostoc sp. LEGE 12447]|uniref:EthD domain-containing protein n=1 Tax=Nostoc sp. LEGE 12447 TaxID=1828640 RepID=UPI001883D735|nr:EthD domain-containing protein [Nostoc sp. LEGE 12447]MBE9001371.1 EthD domain-containing protein [Nostoc sp. LEGE 12447]
MRTANYAQQDQAAQVVFYVALWKRKGISLELFDDYWRNVHGPVCARLPGQYEYWQFHVAHNEGGIWPSIKGINYNTPEEDQFDGIAELTFKTVADRQTWFQASTILMDDEHNLFRKAIGYNTNPGNSITYVDGIENATPNGLVGVEKFHVMLKKADEVSVKDFRQYFKESFASEMIKSDLVLKLRIHLFEEVDNSRPDAAGVSHFEPPQQQYNAAFEIAFSNRLEMEQFFASETYAVAIKDQAKYIKQISPFPERTAYTFVYGGQITLSGQRSSTVADLITKIGAANQIKEDIISLMNGSEKPTQKCKISTPKEKTDIQNNTHSTKSSLGYLLQGVQHVGVTVEDMEKSLEFYTEVLGGKLAVGESELIGDLIQNTLFQKEELDAITEGIDLEILDIPNLRTGNKDALDVKFVSFGNIVIELIYFREVGNPNAPHSSAKSLSSHIGHVNAMHISFNVKEGIDLNVFANVFEEECHKRGMNNVVCNRIIHVNSENERQAVAHYYNSFKFWNEPELLVADKPPIDWNKDPMEGWSLFYCKGPNGEQLEFNQVTRKVKTRFQEALQEYNQANNTSFTFPDTKVSQNILGTGQSFKISDILYSQTQYST